MQNLEQLLSRFNPTTGEIAGIAPVQRRLSDLRGCFVDPLAYELALKAGDPLLYSVATVQPGNAPGDLHYGLGRLMPGRIGSEYYMTKGHLHTRREAAEFYFALAGEGMLLLEDERSGESQIVPLRPEQPAYVPGHTAHRTVNTGAVPLVYLAVYPADAGHDYNAIAGRNFRKVLLERDGRPVLLDRGHVLKSPARLNSKGAR